MAHTILDEVFQLFSSASQFHILKEVFPVLANSYCLWTVKIQEERQNQATELCRGLKMSKNCFKLTSLTLELLNSSPVSWDR